MLPTSDSQSGLRNAGCDARQPRIGTHPGGPACSATATHTGSSTVSQSPVTTTLRTHAQKYEAPRIASHAVSDPAAAQAAIAASSPSLSPQPTITAASDDPSTHRKSRIPTACLPSQRIDR